jgi:hypothetical protein
LVAGLIRERSLVDNGWLAQRLQRGARNAVSRTIREVREPEKRDRKVKLAAEELRKFVNSLTEPNPPHSSCAGAVGRCRHYAKFFEPHLEVLEPFVREFGYEQ